MSEKELIEKALREAKDFSKEIRRYLYEISKDREFTEKEQKFWELTHDVHVHTHDAITLLNEL